MSEYIRRGAVESSASTQHQLDRLAFRVESALSRLRTTAVLHDRWWRPSWQAGYEAGLREAHEATAALLLANGCDWPTAPTESA